MSDVRPYAISMWDFSWLERRWPGAGYEDWDVALGDLVERGYDAVRIDAYPHLVSADPHRQWDLRPAWNQTSWGAQSRVTVCVLPNLLAFIQAARRHGVRVALSTWYREDDDDTRMRIRTPQDQAQIWLDTLRAIDTAGLLDSVLYVDLCNEFPVQAWAPFMYRMASDPPLSRTQPEVTGWMRESIERLRADFPELDYTFSFCTEFATWPEQDVSFLDVLEPHVWMSHPETSGFNARVGYDFQKFDPVGFDNLVSRGRSEYEANREHYDAALYRTIDTVAEWSRATGKGLWTTECWAVVDWKDWPGLDWDWVMDLTARGCERAAASGRWLGMSTSNFCGPQFHGMWREVDWHLRLTDIIRSAPVDPEIATSRAVR